MHINHENPSEIYNEIGRPWEDCLYLGKKPGTKGNRLYYPRNKSVFVSRDVVFQEEKFWAWKENEIAEALFFSQYVEIGYAEDGEVIEEEIGDTGENDTPITPPSQLRTPSTQPGSHTRTDRDSSVISSGVSSGEGPSTRPRQYKSLSQLYHETEIINLMDELMLLKVEGPTSFKEAVNDKEWQYAM